MPSYRLHPASPSLRWLVGVTLILAGLTADSVSAAVDFSRDIRPILSDKCFHCHGPDAESRQSNLRLDLPDSSGDDAGALAVMTPGDPEGSELLRRIVTSDAEERMPPAESGKHLTEEEVEQIRAWIAEGAKWSLHWAYQLPTPTPTPAVAQREWPRNPIDYFILSELEARTMQPSEAADPVTLLRRLSFDLTGLPPAAHLVPPETEAAYLRLVDQLLASPAFGERFAAYWLDLVRYADTVGYHGDQDHAISPYRDYVIDALNQNRPFDRFTVEQLAGDLLPNPTTQQRIASGYNRLLQTSHEGGVQPKEYLAIYAADRVRNLSSVWLGATMGCCQCHDHKYDPYTMHDFYSMVAFFADLDEERHFTDGGNSLPTNRQPELEVLARRDEVIGEIWSGRRRRMVKALDRTPADHMVERGELESEITAIDVRLAALPSARRRTMISLAKEPRTIRLLPRGNWLDETGPVVSPAVPEFLAEISARPGVGTDRATRLDLANWLVDPDDGIGLLTARVQVNRLWYLFFGEGLSRRLDDLGGQGAPPSHPELLDYLAREFVARQWDWKSMVRLIVTSAAYRQTSTPADTMSRQDPENRWFGRQGRWRLPAEMVRDNLLSVSELLVPGLGGASVKPYQPEGYYRHLNFPTRTYEAHRDRRQWRRGVYVHWQRQFLHPMYRAFDAPSREECTAQRPTSNTPIASLVLLNDPSSVEAARAFAARILHATPGAPADERVELAFQLALSRRPVAREREDLTSYVDEARRLLEQRPEIADQIQQIGIDCCSPSLDRHELATWTLVARVVLNLGEFVTRY